MEAKNWIEKTVAFVKETLQNAEGGHDWWHTYRVWQNARTIAATEQVDLITVELGALLHDIADAKFHNGDEGIGPAVARAFLLGILVEEDRTEHIENIIRNISFRTNIGSNSEKFDSKELAVIQDADRLDAIGAIGIARAFNYGGFKNRSLYDPNVPANLNMTKEEYAKSSAPTINHFYEKLLLLKSKMKTETG
ncbi:MAG: HD domain-containing protein, partial [Cyclobacteriaceae bacterium]